MSATTRNIPSAPLPPRAARPQLGPYEAHDFQHLLLLQAQRLRGRRHLAPEPPRPPAPMIVRRGLLPSSDWTLDHQLDLAARRLKSRRLATLHSAPPAPPAPPAPARLARDWAASPLTLKQQLKPAALLLKSRRAPLAPPPPPPPARLRSWSSGQPLPPPFGEQIARASADLVARRTKRTALPRAVQEEAVRAAKDLRKAQAQRNPPLAPAAPAPVLSAAATELHRPLGDKVVSAAKEMHLAHYPPLAPANPAPDVIPRDALSSKPLQEKLLPAAIHAMQQVADHPGQAAATTIPQPPPAPRPHAKATGQAAVPLRDQLYSAAKQKKLARRQALKPHREFIPAARSIEPVHAVVPPVAAAAVPSSVPPPLPPRPAVTLAAMAAMRGGNGVVHEPERVIEHAPIMEKEIINERPVQVKHEHHIQPVVHEVEHRVQPIIKTEATTAATIIEKDKNVMLPAIVEPPVMATAPMATPVLNAAPKAAPASSFPQTRAAPAMPMAWLGGEGRLDSEERMGVGQVAPLMPGEREIVLEGLPRHKAHGHHDRGLHAADTHHHHHHLSPTTAPGLGTTTHAAAGGALSPNASTAGRSGRRGSIGMKIKGAVKEVTGTITRNPAKVEEGKMLLHGVDPAATTTNASAASPLPTASNSRI